MPIFDLLVDLLRRAIEGLRDHPAQNAPWGVLLLPLCGFTVLALFGDWINRQKEQYGATLLACGTVLGSFGFAVWSVWALFHLAPTIPEGATANPHNVVFAQPFLFDWIEAAGFRVPLSLLLDPLSSVMILVVTGIGSLIHVYSLGYMSHDEERVRYFSYLNLFTFFMLLLVLGGNLPVMFVGWEGVGLCSYLLIGFWFKKKSASDAGKKAFIVNRIGDAGLILGMILAFHRLGSVDLVALAENAASKVPEVPGEWGLYTAVCLLLFVGACGKSAQIPLHVWLPDAMEGPTPVSALIHAATMVTAGVYMVARLAPLYHLSPTAMSVVAGVGCATALMAATVALVQTDIKKVLAYSTVSQLGYMFLACGVGAFGVGIFHLATHAFFKALLFLGSGSVIHALSGEQDMRQMGGLRKKIPWTFATFFIGTLAIAGIPPLAGFVSKDAILAAALGGHHSVLFGLGMFTALLTAFYMSRLLFLTFFGSYRGPLDGHGADQGHADAHGHDAHGHDDSHDAHGHGGHGAIHESPWSMLGPLVILAIGSIGAGFIPIPHLLEAVLRVPAEHGEHWAPLPFVATAVALLGIGAAYYLYVARPDLPAGLARTFAAPKAVFEAKYYFDDVFNWFAARVVVDGSSSVLWKGVDARLIDGAVNGLGAVVDHLGRGVRTLQSGLIRGYALMILGGAVALLGYLLWMPR